MKWSLKSLCAIGFLLFGIQASAGVLYDKNSVAALTNPTVYSVSTSGRKIYLKAGEHAIIKLPTSSVVRVKFGSVVFVAVITAFTSLAVQFIFPTTLQADHQRSLNFNASISFMLRVLRSIKADRPEMR
jgi:hypothetical protein